MSGPEQLARDIFSAMRECAEDAAEQDQYERAVENGTDGASALDERRA